MPRRTQSERSRHSRPAGSSGSDRGATASGDGGSPPSETSAATRGLLLPLARRQAAAPSDEPPPPIDVAGPPLPPPLGELRRLPSELASHARRSTSRPWPPPARMHATAMPRLASRRSSASSSRRRRRRSALPRWSSGMSPRSKLCAPCACHATCRAASRCSVLVVCRPPNSSAGHPHRCGAARSSRSHMNWRRSASAARATSSSAETTPPMRPATMTPPPAGASSEQ